MKNLSTQILVAGAGPAGVCAALTAARQGFKVVLASNRPVLGGNSSSEIRVWMRGATGAGNLFSEEMGTLGELKLRNQYVNPDGNPMFWDDVQLDAVLQEENITLLLNTEVFEPRVEGGRIRSVRAIQMGSEKQFDIEAEWYVDCTGDGTVAAGSGLAYYIGNTLCHDRREEQTHRDGILGSTVFYYVRSCDHPVKFIPPSYAYDLETVEKLVGKGGRVVDEHQGGSDYWWFEYGGLTDTIGQQQEIGLELRRLVMGVWNYIKNSGKFDADYVTLEWVGSFPGKRESRRMESAHLFTKEELLGRVPQPDAGFYGGWYIDDHPAEGFLTEEANCVQLPVNIYELPLSTLYNPKVENLLFAGRTIGVDRQVFFSSRVMDTCALSGQAAATLAGVCLERGLTTAGIDAGVNEETRRRLQRDDMLLFDWVDDPDEVGSKARVTVSSVWSGDVPEGSETLPLTEETFVTLPALGRSQVRLGLRARRDAVLRGTWHSAALPSRYCPGERVGEVSIPVPAGADHVDLPLPEGPDHFATLILAPAEDLDLALSPIALPGLVCGRTAMPGYKTPVTRLPAYGRGEELAGPYNRPWKTVNGWVPGEEKPWATLEWAEPQTIREVRIFFDPELSQELPSTRTAHVDPSHRFSGREGMPSQLVKGYALWVRRNGAWERVFTTGENWKRMAVHRLPQPVEADGVKLEISATWGGSPGVVYGLRVYRS